MRQKSTNETKKIRGQKIASLFFFSIINCNLILQGMGCVSHVAFWLMNSLII